MPQPVVTRTQRRTEKRQITWILVLVAGVAVASFALGYALGQRGGELPRLSNEAQKPRLPMATKSVPPPPETTDKPVESDKLTFYDNLPKGDQAPLGSGINLPPKPGEAVPAKKQPKVASAPPKPAAKVAPKVEKIPTSSPSGAFVVQVASFRTEGDARKLMTRLQKLKLTTMVERADLAEKGVWYRVLTGPYDTRDDAGQVADRLQKEERLSALVRRR